MDTTILDVIFNIASAKTFTKGWHTNIVKWRNLYNSNHYDKNPLPGESQFNDPTYTNTVDLAVGIMLTNPIIWKATAWKPGEGIQKLESQVEKFLIGVLESNITRNEYDTNYEVLLHYVRDGGCVLYTVWDDILALAERDTDELTDEKGNVIPINVYNSCPVVQQVIDPLTVSFLPGGSGRWLAVVREEEVTLQDVKLRFGALPKGYQHLDNDFQAMLQTKGSIQDYWDCVYDKKGGMQIRNATLFDNEYIPGRELEVMPKYKSLPYTLGLYKPSDRVDSSKWSSILTPLESPVKELEKNVNRRQRQIDMYSSLPLVSKTANGRVVTLDAGMGKIASLSQDEDLGFPQWQGNPPDLERQIELQRSRIQQSGFSDVFYGTSTGGASGYELSQLGDQNRIRLEQPIAHLKRFWEMAGRKEIEVAVENTDDQTFVRIYGKIRGEPFTSLVSFQDLQGFHITVEIKPNFPNDQVRKHAMGNQVRGVLSEETIMERYLDIQQPDDEYDRKIMEQVQSNPMTMQYAIMKVMEEQAANGDVVAQKVLMQMQQQGMQGQAGRPPEPQNNEQYLGVPQPGSMESGAAAPNMAGGV